MIYTYFDGRGLEVSEEKIQEMLTVIGKLEDEVINFLGHKAMEQDGRALAFLESMVAQHNYFEGSK